MTPNEIRFLHKFTAAKQQLFHQSVLKHLPGKLAELPTADGASKPPDLAKYVACRVMRTLDEPIPLDPL